MQKRCRAPVVHVWGVSVFKNLRSTHSSWSVLFDLINFIMFAQFLSLAAFGYNGISTAVVQAVVSCQMCYCPYCRHVKTSFSTELPKACYLLTCHPGQMTKPSSFLVWLLERLFNTEQQKKLCLNSLFKIVFCHLLCQIISSLSLTIWKSYDVLHGQRGKGNECQSTLLSICLSIPPGDDHLLTISIILYRQCKCKLQLNPCANSLPLHFIRCFILIVNVAGLKSAQEISKTQGWVGLVRVSPEIIN